MKDEQSNALTDTDRPILLAGHHLEDFKDYCKEETVWSKQGFYSKDFFQKTYELYHRMAANHNLRVLLINTVLGGDDICKNCPFANDMDADCNIYFESLGRRDEQTARDMSLEIGKIYHVSEIIKAFSKVKQL